MKKISIILALVLSIFMVFVLGSCAEADVKTKVNIKFIVGNQNPYLIDKEIVVKTSPDNENGPSVIDVIKTLMDTESINIELIENGERMSLGKFGAYYETTYEGISYFWSFTINGKDPVGAANNNYLKEGDTIEYTFMSTRPDPDGGEQAITAPYDNTDDIFLDELANIPSDSNDDTADVE